LKINNSYLYERMHHSPQSHRYIHFSPQLFILFYEVKRLNICLRNYSVHANAHGTLPHLVVILEYPFSIMDELMTFYWFYLLHPIFGGVSKNNNLWFDKSMCTYGVFEFNLNKTNNSIGNYLLNLLKKIKILKSKHKKYLRFVLKHQ